MFVGLLNWVVRVSLMALSEFIPVKKISHPILSTEDVKRGFVFLTLEAGDPLGVVEKHFSNFISVNFGKIFLFFCLIYWACILKENCSKSHIKKQVATNDI